MADDKTQKAQQGDDDAVPYFNAKAFVEKVMEDCDLGDIAPELRSELEEEIERSLGERITATIISAFTERDMDLYDKVKAENPQFDQMEVIALVAADIPGLAEKLLKAIQDLYEELTYDAAKIQQAMDRRKEAENTKL